MSDKRRNYRKTCDMCARITPRDMSRGFCPVGACNIHRGRPADRCRMFVMDEECAGRRGGWSRERRDVC